MANPIMNFGNEGDVGRRSGMYYTITALGAVAGPPISGAINARTGGFEGVGLFAGTLKTSHHPIEIDMISFKNRKCSCGGCDLYGDCEIPCFGPMDGEDLRRVLCIGSEVRQIK